MTARGLLRKYVQTRTQRKKGIGHLCFMASADASASLWETYKRCVGSILSTTDQELAYTTAVSSFLASGCVPLSSTAAVREVSGVKSTQVLLPYTVHRVE